MANFDEIRFYEDAEVHEALQQYVKHPMIRALLQFTFPELPLEEIEKRVLSCHSIRDFQTTII